MQAFPRFFYVSDDSLLQILSSPLSPSSLTPYLPSLFTNTRSLITQSPGTKEEDKKEEAPVIITAVESAEGERLDLVEPVIQTPILCFFLHHNIVTIPTYT